MGFVGLSHDKSIFFRSINNLGKTKRHYVKNIEYELKKAGIRNEDESILGVFEESCLGDTMGDLHLLLLWVICICCWIWILGVMAR